MTAAAAVIPAMPTGDLPRRHLQTIFAPAEGETGPPGNCLQAAIASLLGLDLDVVPHFVAVDHYGGEPYPQHLRRFLAVHGWTRLGGVDPEPGELYCAIGPSPRGPWHHIVIHRDGELVHDPHPDGTGITAVACEWVLRRAPAPTTEATP